MNSLSCFLNLILSTILSIQIIHWYIRISFIHFTFSYQFLFMFMYNKLYPFKVYNLLSFTHPWIQQCNKNIKYFITAKRLPMSLFLLPLGQYNYWFAFCHYKLFFILYKLNHTVCISLDLASLSQQIDLRFIYVVCFSSFYSIFINEQYSNVSTYYIYLSTHLLMDI